MFKFDKKTGEVLTDLAPYYARRPIPKQRANPHLDGSKEIIDQTPVAVGLHAFRPPTLQEQIERLTYLGAQARYDAEAEGIDYEWDDFREHEEITPPEGITPYEVLGTGRVKTPRQKPRKVKKAEIPAPDAPAAPAATPTAPPPSEPAVS